jgi:hypothetical protein
MTLEYRMIANSSTFRAFSSPIICLTRIIGVVWRIVDEIGWEGKGLWKGIGERDWGDGIGERD